jgi:hypothetical protein
MGILLSALIQSIVAGINRDIHRHHTRIQNIKEQYKPVHLICHQLSGDAA